MGSTTFDGWPAEAHRAAGRHRGGQPRRPVARATGGARRAGAGPDPRAGGGAGGRVRAGAGVPAARRPGGSGPTRRRCAPTPAGWRRRRAAAGWRSCCRSTRSRSRSGTGGSTPGPAAPLSGGRRRRGVGRGAGRAAAAARRVGLPADPEGELQILPRGWKPDHPRVWLARRRGLQVVRRWELGPWVATPEPLERVRSAWRAAAPLVEWLDTHVGPAVAPQRDPARRRRSAGCGGAVDPAPPPRPTRRRYPCPCDPAAAAQRPRRSGSAVAPVAGGVDEAPVEAAVVEEVTAQVPHARRLPGEPRLPAAVGEARRRARPPPAARPPGARPGAPT